MKKAILTILIMISGVMMASEVEDQNYWWLQFVAAAVLVITIKVICSTRR